MQKAIQWQSCIHTMCRHSVEASHRHIRPRIILLIWRNPQLHVHLRLRFSFSFPTFPAAARAIPCYVLASTSFAFTFRSIAGGPVLVALAFASTTLGLGPLLATICWSCPQKERSIRRILCLRYPSCRIVRVVPVIALDGSWHHNHGFT